MSHSFAAFRTKIQRAEEHIKQCEVAVERFKATKPYAVVRRPELRAGEIVYDVRRIDQVPLEVSAIAGDALRNLRNALDYLARALTRTPTRKTHFPILDQLPTRSQLQTFFNRTLSETSQEVIDKIINLKPYEEGNAILWRLHKLYEVDKHRPIFTGQGAFSNASYPGDSRIDWISARGGFPLGKGNQFFVGAALAKINGSPEFVMDVVIDEPEICRGSPVPIMTTLRESLEATIRVVIELEPYMLR